MHHVLDQVLLVNVVVCDHDVRGEGERGAREEILCLFASVKVNNCMVAVPHFDLASLLKPSCLQSNNHDGVYLAYLG